MSLNQIKLSDYKLLAKEEKQELKQIIIENKLHREVGQFSLKNYRLFQKEHNGIYYPTLNDYSFQDLENEIKEFVNLYGYTTFKIANNVNHASYKRTARLKERIREAVESGSAWFITITFSPETLENTNEQTRRKYVSRWLKSLTPFMSLT